MNAIARAELKKQMRKTVKHHAESGESYVEMVDLIDEQYHSHWPGAGDEVWRVRMEVENELIAEGILFI